MLHFLVSALLPLSTNSRSLSSGEDDNGTTEFKESEVLKDSIILYGGLLVVTIVAFSWLRRRFPRVYNVRNWVDDLKTYLAEDQYRFFSWMWRVYMVTDDEIMDQCGLDAACFIHLIQMGYRLSMVALFNMLWLLPIYRTSEESEETADISDRVVKTTIANVPSGSLRLYGTVLAAYIMFGYTMYQILVEFEWYIEMRHKFLRKPLVRHFAIFVRNIPPMYRNNQRLEEFFSNCFSNDSVLEARLAIHTPSLGRLVAQREATVANLEHAQAKYERDGVRPRQKEQLMLLGESLDSIEYYTEQLKEQNKELTERVEALQAIVNGSAPPPSQRTRQYPQTPDTEVSGAFSFEDEESISMQLPPHLATSNGSQEMKQLDDDVSANHASEHTSSTCDMTDTERGESFNVNNALRRSLHSSVTTAKAVAQVAGTATSAASKVANLAVRESVKFANRAVSMILGGDGEVHSAAFVVFTKRSITNAAKQMIHHEKPFAMEVMEAPDPKDVYWANIGRTHKDLQLGMLASFGMSVGLCLLWTIPMSFFASLSNASAVRQDIEWLDDLFNRYPRLVQVTEQLAPLLVVAFNWILPNILEAITLCEGPISSGKVQASKFIKLAAFTIIQTFFVSAISGSVIQAISDIIDDWTKIIDLLANSLPAQGTYFMQIVLVTTATDAGVEMLRLIPISLAILRAHMGPRLTEKQRNKVYVGLRPLSCPQDFEHADYTAQLVLYFMVLFVFAVIYPLTPLITLPCFAFMGAMFRGQFMYIYDKNPDSGGKLWAHYIQVMLSCMLIAEITIFGLLGLKKAVKQLPLYLPLMFITVLFNFYIRQIHFRVASYLPTRECLMEDNQHNGGIDLSFARGAYIQPSLAAAKSIIPVSNKDDSPASTDSPSDDEELATNGQMNGEFSECLGTKPSSVEKSSSLFPLNVSLVPSSSIFSWSSSTD